MKSIVTLLPALLVLAACSTETVHVPQPPDARPAQAASSTTESSDMLRAQKAAFAFSGRLQGALQARMAETGPIGAIDFCHEQAPVIAAEVAAEHGVSLGRVPVPGKARNPANTATDWQIAALQALQDQQVDGTPVTDLVFRQAGGLPDGVALRTMKGIGIQPACLACHGSDVAEPIRAAIAAHYPDDAATGFALGDLRGGLWVEVPAH